MQWFNLVFTLKTYRIFKFMWICIHTFKFMYSRLFVLCMHTLRKILRTVMVGAQTCILESTACYPVLKLCLLIEGASFCLPGWNLTNILCRWCSMYQCCWKSMLSSAWGPFNWSWLVIEGLWYARTFSSFLFCIVFGRHLKPVCGGFHSSHLSVFFSLLHHHKMKLAA